jgi:hypothetical protein
MTERWQVNFQSGSGRSPASVHRMVRALLSLQRNHPSDATIQSNPFLLRGTTIRQPVCSVIAQLWKCLRPCSIVFANIHGVPNSSIIATRAGVLRFSNRFMNSFDSRWMTYSGCFHSSGREMNLTRSPIFNSFGLGIFVCTKESM